MAPLGRSGSGRRVAGVSMPPLMSPETGLQPFSAKLRLCQSILFCRAGESGIDESVLRPFGPRLFVDVACAQV